jgi:hypothetical protein|tara:strand:- start:539 stop:997 length:459 start_codon:yes stop_codon:yes gene_type:complete
LYNIVIKQKGENMSAYQVDERVLGDVMKAVKLAGIHGREYKGVEKHKMGATETPNFYAQQLLKWNRYSLEQRYPDDAKELFFDVNFDKIVTHSKSIINNNKAQMLKSFECYMYQTCEGDSTEKDWYKVLDSIKDQLAYELAHQHPMYANAKW